MSQRSFGGRGSAPHGGGSFNKPRAPPRVKLVAAQYQSGPLIVIANCFKVTQLPTKQYWHYDEIKPKLFNRARAIELVDELQVNNPQVFPSRAIYDGRANLFSTRELNLSNGPFGSYAVRKYTISINKTAGELIDCSAIHNVVNRRAAASPLSDTATTVLQLLIRAAPNLMQAGQDDEIHHVRGPRAYYTDFGKQPIGGGLELWQGLFQSARPTIGNMLINVDISMSAMIKSGPLENVAMDIIGQNELRALYLSDDRDPNFKRLTSMLKGVFVLVKGAPGPRRRKRIRGLVLAAGLREFNTDTKQTTVERHFRELYNIHLSHPKMVGIWTGNPENKAVFPFEVCTVQAGQFYKKKVPSRFTDDVVRFATKSPADRLATITGGIGHPSDPRSLRAPALEYADSPFIRNSGMQVSTVPLEIKGTVMVPPTLTFANASQSEKPSHGSWNFVRKQFSTPVKIARWAVVCFDPRTDNRTMEGFVEGLKSCLGQLGILHQNPARVLGNAQNVVGALADVGRALGGPPQIILFILPQEGEEIKRKIKYTCETNGHDYGVATQCVRSKKVANPNNQYLNNIGLKINARLGGENSVVNHPAMTKFRSGKKLVLGADVGHPGAGVTNQPSVSSVCWSCDPNAVKWRAQMRIQEPRAEIIEGLEDMVKFALQDFAKIAQGPPESIIFYRDGVSEGQFEQVRVNEISAVQSAIDATFQGWEKQHNTTLARPKLSFLVVGKRHHMRFFPKDGAGQDSSGNCPAGFLAQEGIQSPNPAAPDYYLLSHGGLLGTSRPGHYTVLRDDHKDLKWLQELSFSLCHCYASATRSVSIPAPVYYADKACARAKYHYEHDIGSVISDDDAFDLGVWQARFKDIHPVLRKQMFFL